MGGRYEGPGREAAAEGAASAAGASEARVHAPREAGAAQLTEVVGHLLQRKEKAGLQGQ
jgi:hypothetical protein